MSTQLPTRRTRQAARPNADENANRAIRATRSKVLGGAPDSQPTKVLSSLPSNSNNPTSRAEAISAAAKRKREALGEVTNNKNSSKAVDLKDGQKPTAAAVKRNAPTSLTTVSGARIPLGERRKAQADDVKADEVELETQRTIRGSTRISTRTTTTVGVASTRQRTSVSTAATARHPTTSSSKIGTAAASTLRGRPSNVRRPLNPAQSKVAHPPEHESQPAQKKRRTSSVGPEETTEDRTDRKVLDDVAEESEAIGVDDTDAIEVDAPAAKSGGIVAEAWDDLDKEDANDPLMVSEYVNEIFQYLQKLELTTMPNPKYMDTQEELAWRMRGILTDWLIQIHGRFRMLPETLFLTINIIDRFLSARVVSLVKLQLVGITALFIAAKYEEIMAPSVSNFIYCADGNYTEKDILEAEKYILRTLDWNLSYPNPIHFLRRSSKADGYDLASRTVAKYFSEISCLEHRLLEAPPSMIAAASIWLSRLVLDKEEWTPTLIHYSGYEEEAIIPAARIMLNYVLKPIRHENFHKKYAARKFLKASTFVNTWVRDRWVEGTSVDLEAELPELRRNAQLRREAGTAAGQLAEDEGVLI